MPLRLLPLLLALVTAKPSRAPAFDGPQTAGGARAERRGLVLNELLASNATSSRDEDGRTSDWVELRNASGAAVALAGLYLSDDPEEPRKWALPAMALAPGGHLLIWLSGEDRRELAPQSLQRSASLFSIGEPLVREGDRWRYIVARGFRGDGPPAGWFGRDFDDSLWSAGPSGFGYGDGDDATELPDDTSGVFARREFELESLDGIWQLILSVDYDDAYVAYLNGEFLVAANAPDRKPSFRTAALDKREAGEAERHDITARRELLRKGRNVLAVAGLNDADESTDFSLIPELWGLPPVCHANFRLQKEGGTLLLADAAGVVIDRVDYPLQFADQSYGRRPAKEGRGDWAFFLTPTAGAPNRYRPRPAPVLARVEVSPGSGLYPEAQSVAVMAHGDEALEIRYTTDGSEPRASSPLFREGSPVAIESTTGLRVAGFLDGERATPVTRADYFIGDGSGIPILSISMDPVDFRTVQLRSSARGRSSERPAHLEFLGLAGESSRIAIDCGLRLHGGAGRSGGMSTKKSYRTYFRRAYGAARLIGRVIPDTKLASFDKLVLRGNYNDRFRGGRDANLNSTYIRDQVIRDVHGDMGGIVSHGAWYALYVNMEYRGIFNVVERLDRDFLQDYLGGTDWDVIKTGDEVLDGSLDAWQELIEMTQSLDFSSDAAYDRLLAVVDIENFTDYVIVNTWAQNHDWPHNNWYAARRREPGAKWIFLCWDAEWGMGRKPTGYREDTVDWTLNRGRSISYLFRSFWAHPRYAKYFLERARKHLAGALRAQNVIRHIERHRRRIAPLVAREIELYAKGFVDYDQWEANVEALRDFARNRPEYFLRSVEAKVAAQLAVERAKASPVAFESSSPGVRTRHIVYRDESGDLMELRRRAADGESRWLQENVSDAASAPRAADRPSVMVVDSEHLLAYRTEDGRIHLLTRRALDDGSLEPWMHLDLTALTGGARATGKLAMLDWAAARSRHIFYRGVDAYLHELRWLRFPSGGSPRWVPFSLGAMVTPRQGIQGDPSCFVSLDQSLHVLFRGTNRLTQELWARKPPAGELTLDWYHGYVLSRRQIVQGAGDPIGHAWTLGNQPTRQVVVRDSGGRLQEMWRVDVPAAPGASPFGSGMDWKQLDLTALLPSLRAVSDPVLFVRESDGSRHVVFVGADLHLHDLYQKASESRPAAPLRGHDDLTELAGAPLATSTPSVCRGGESLVYRDADGGFHEIHYDGGTWKHRSIERESEGR